MSVVSTRFATDSVRERLLPKTFMIGAAKAGTTFLAWLLGKHPQIHLGREKEPEFFSFDEHFDRGLDWYLDLYEEAQPGQLLLDASTGYTRYPQYPDAAARLYDHAPDAKLIYVLRDPVQRAYSHYVHRWSKELHINEPFDVPFEEHIKSDPMCIQSSDYRLQIQQYLKYFSSDAILCVFSHELRSNPDAVVRQVCDFIGVQDHPDLRTPADGRDNDSSKFLESRIRVAITDRIKSFPIVSTGYKMLPQSVRELGYRMIRRSTIARASESAFSPPPMKPETQERLRDQFRESNEWVAAFTGTELPIWEQ